MEALHLAGATAARPPAVRVLPPHLPLRVALGPRYLPGPRPAAPPEAPEASRRAVLLLHRLLLHRPIRHRSAPPRQLLARRLPRPADRERGRSRRRRGRPRLGAPPIQASDLSRGPTPLRWKRPTGRSKCVAPARRLNHCSWPAALVALPTPTRISPAPTTEQEQHHKNDQ